MSDPRRRGRGRGRGRGPTPTINDDEKRNGERRREGPMNEKVQNGPIKNEGPWGRAAFEYASEGIRHPQLRGGAQNRDSPLSKSHFPPLPGTETEEQWENSSDDVLESTSSESTDEQWDDIKSQDSQDDVKSTTTKTEGESEDCRNSKDHVVASNSQMNCSSGQGTSNKSEETCINNKEVEEGVDTKPPSNDMDKGTSNKSEETYINNKEVEEGVDTKPPSNDTDEAVESNLSPFAKEFIPGIQHMEATPDGLSCVPIDVEALKVALEETVNFCYAKLNEAPAEYDDLMEVVTPQFMKFMHHHELLLNLVRHIYNYARSDATFSYFAAKILIHLITAENTDFGKHDLRDFVLSFSQDEAHNTMHYYLLNQSLTFASTALPYLNFLSELYIQLEAGGKRLAYLGRTLVDILRQLLYSNHIPIKERLKTTTTLVKLTGLSLEEDIPTGLDELLFDLQTVTEIERANLDDPTIQHVSDIISLRDVNWGQAMGENVPLVPQDPQLQNGYDQDLSYCESMATFYGPDGQVMPFEEEMFLQTESMRLISIDDQGQYSPVSMDGEMEAAYDEFLLTVPRNIR